MSKTCAVSRSSISTIFLFFMGLCGLFACYADESIVDLCSQSRFPPISPQDIALMETAEVRDAEESLNRGDCASAIEYYNNAITQYPNSPMLHYRRGFCYAVLDNISKALDDYNLVVELDPNFSLAYSDLAYAYLQVEKYQEAIANFNYLTEKGICDSFSLKSRGIAHYKIGELGEAQKDLEAALILLVHEQGALGSLPNDTYDPEELEIKELLEEILQLRRKGQ